MKKDLSCILVLEKFYDIPLVAYTSEGLSLIASKIGTPIMLDSCTNNMCLDSWGRSSYARVLIEISVSNGFCDNLIMVVPKLNGSGYTKKYIRIKYEWETPHCGTCLLFGYSLDECPKAAPKRVVNGIDKGKSQRVRVYQRRFEILMRGLRL